MKRLMESYSIVCILDKKTVYDPTKMNTNEKVRSEPCAFFQIRRAEHFSKLLGGKSVTFQELIDQLRVKFGINAKSPGVILVSQ